MALFRDQGGAARLVATLGPFLRDDFVVTSSVGLEEYAGLEGLKTAVA